MNRIALMLAVASFTIVPAIAADTVKPGDKTFAEKIAVDGMAEVKLGEMASKKGTASKVKEFGQHMVKDHSKANDELKELAIKHGLKLPTAIDAEHQAVHDKLAKLSGAEFDKEYLNEMVSAHKKAVNALETESKDGGEPFKGWATKTLPTIKEHLKEAEADDKNTKG